MKTFRDLKVAMYSIFTAISTSYSYYSGQVPENASYPYAHFSFDQSNDVEGREDFIMNVQVWDKNYGSSDVDTLMNAIDQKLNRSNYHSTGINFTIYRINRMSLPSDDEFQGRELKYLVKAYLTTT
jgi:hypothetical protein